LPQKISRQEIQGFRFALTILKAMLRCTKKAHPTCLQSKQRERSQPCTDGSQATIDESSDQQTNKECRLAQTIGDNSSAI
jgi:hypothetical protein